MAISDFSALALKIAVFPSHLIENMAAGCLLHLFIDFFPWFFWRFNKSLCVELLTKNILPFCSQHLELLLQSPHQHRVKCLNRFPIKNASLSQPWRINTGPHKRQVSFPVVGGKSSMIE